MNIDELKLVAAAIVAKQKGLLAADESSPTIKKRFDAIQLESTEENRRRYRELLFTLEASNAISAASFFSMKHCARTPLAVFHLYDCCRNAGSYPA